MGNQRVGMAAPTKALCMIGILDLLRDCVRLPLLAYCLPLLDQQWINRLCEASVSLYLLVS